MTIIGSITIPPTKDYPAGRAVCITDSMGSFRGHPRFVGKEDSVRKLYLVNGRHVVMGTGDGGAIQQLVQRAERVQHEAVDELACEIHAQMELLKLDPEKRPHFVVAGPQQTGNIVHYRVGVEGQNALPQNVMLWPGQVAFDGSGLGHLDGYMWAAQATGKYLIIDDWSDALAVGFEGLRSAAQDAHVDDKLQLALVDHEGVRTLYHPDVQLPNTVAAPYQSKLTGYSLDFSEPFSTLESDADVLDAANQVIDGFYDAFIGDIRHMANASKMHTGLVEFAFHEKVSPDVVDEYLARRAAAKEQVELGAQTLLRGGAANLAAYISNRAERIATVAKKLE